MVVRRVKFMAAALVGLLGSAQLVQAADTSLVCTCANRVGFCLPKAQFCNVDSQECMKTCNCNADGKDWTCDGNDVCSGDQVRSHCGQLSRGMRCACQSTTTMTTTTTTKTASTSTLAPSAAAV